MREGLAESPGIAKQLTFNEPDSAVQILPTVQGEKAVTALLDTGDMIKFAAALHVEVVRGQHVGLELVREQPGAQS